MENTRGAIVRWGLLFGGIMALLGSTAAIVTILLEGSLASDPSSVRAFTAVTLVSGLVSCGLNVVYLALFFVAGILTARRTGNVRSGALAGLLAGGLGGLINGAVAVTLLFLSPALFPSGSTLGIPIAPAATHIPVWIVITAIVGLVIWCGVGAGLGALGALVGQSQFRAAHPELAQPRPYPSAPYPGNYPPTPPMGAYPPPPPGVYAPSPGTYPPPPPGAYPPPSPLPPPQPGQ
jgi:hypothetical protein